MKKNNPNFVTGMSKGASQDIFIKAKNLRNNATNAENILWNRLRDNQIDGIKFRRQHPISLYILDFYCHKYKLAIEIDGAYHNTIEQKIRDDNRTKELKKLGIDLIRFKNEEVENDIDSVIERITSKIESLH